MGKIDVQLLLLLLFILCLHCVGIYFFTGGFLLTRTELSAISTCVDAEPSGCNLHPGRAASDLLHRRSSEREPQCPVGEAQESCPELDANHEQTGYTADRCWTEPLVKRVVVLIIDALRFDFVAPTSNSTDEPAPWVNQLKILQQLVGTEGLPAKLFKFIADPPTTTVQRLKGLTTGGLPTFMDIGHSFGAPAIVEDNLLLQLIRVKKRVMMMGDDTWMQLFPTHFEEAYPFPSLNVKDLHTVDDGVIKEILPALRRKNWDLLIGHLLGVDHVGHIFGVESPLMVEKLRQYNQLIKDILMVLLEDSQPGSMHDNTLFIVMGDHGQTLNGDHGGGTPEEVETALFAVATKDLSPALHMNLSSYTLNVSRHESITTLSQLDFASTMAAIMGTPIPFGSVGQVNPVLWALAAGFDVSVPSDGAAVLEYLHHYSQTLCINCWQVKRYLESYSARVRNGFPMQELLNLQQLYAEAQALSEVNGTLSCLPEHIDLGNKAACIKVVKQQIDAYSSFLSAAASLARSQWTQFRVGWMAMGLVVICASLAVQGTALNRATILWQSKCKGIDSGDGLFPAKEYVVRSLVYTLTLVTVAVMVAAVLHAISPTGPGHPDAQFRAVLPGLLALAACITFILPTESSRKQRTVVIRRKWTLNSACSSFFVLLHTCSLFSNSFIVGEGSVVTYLMASIGILYLRQSLKRQANVIKAVCFLLLNFGLVTISILALPKDSASAKDIASLADMCKYSASVLLWTFGLACLPLLGIFLLIRQHVICHRPHLKTTWLVLKAALPATYGLIVLHWLINDVSVCLSYVSGGNNGFSTAISQSLVEFARLQLPRMVYVVSIVITVITIFSPLNLHSKGQVEWQNRVNETLIILLASWSGTIMLLVGKKGPAIILFAVLEALCLRDLVTSNATLSTMPIGIRTSSMADWNFFALQLFFCTGHRCTFDALNYTAAFMGFDDFNFFRQGFLLALDTFGTSHVLPVLALPLLIVPQHSNEKLEDDAQRNNVFLLKIGQLYISYGLVRALTATASVFSAALQRRHLMVWGLFAPKFVFDAVGLIVSDVFIVSTMLIIVFCKRTMKLNKTFL